MMKKLFLLLLCACSLHRLSAQVNGDNVWPDADTNVSRLDSASLAHAKLQAVRFVQLLTDGNFIDSLKDICAVPFAWDGREVITSWPDLKLHFDKVISKKGKGRSFVIDTVYCAGTRNIIMDNVVPVSCYYIIVTLSLAKKKDDKDSERILFSVSMGGKPMVTGFRD